MLMQQMTKFFEESNDNNIRMDDAFTSTPVLNLYSRHRLRL
jgi:hypothetical protein